MSRSHHSIAFLDVSHSSLAHSPSESSSRVDVVVTLCATRADWLASLAYGRDAKRARAFVTQPVVRAATSSDDFSAWSFDGDDACDQRGKELTSGSGRVAGARATLARARASDAIFIDLDRGFGERDVRATVRAMAIAIASAGKGECDGVDDIGMRFVCAFSPTLARFAETKRAELRAKASSARSNSGRDEEDALDEEFWSACVARETNAREEDEAKGWANAWRPNAYEDRGRGCKFHNYHPRGCALRDDGRCENDHERCMYCFGVEDRDVGPHGARMCPALARAAAEAAVECQPALLEFVARAPTPSARNRARLIARASETKPYVYVIGGRNRGLTLGVCERYDIVGDVWERAPNLREPRGSHGACAIDSTLFVVGGGGVRSNLASMETLDLASERGGEAWTLSGDVVAPRHAMSAASTRGKVYVVGGWYDGSVAIGDTDIYDSNTKTWASGAKLNVPRRLHGVAATAVGDVFVFGGWGADGVETDSAERFDPESNAWRAIAPLPAPACATACAIGDDCYVFSWGSQGAKSKDAAKTKMKTKSKAPSGGFYRYDVARDTYEFLGALPLKNWFGFTVAAHDDVLYVIGGIVDGRWTGRAFAFHVAERAWEELAPMSYVRRRAAACAVDVPLAYSLT